MAIYCWPFVAACEKMINFMAIYWVSWPSWMKAFIKAFYNKLSQTARVGQATIHNIQCTYVCIRFQLECEFRLIQRIRFFWFHIVFEGLQLTKAWSAQSK